MSRTLRWAWRLFFGFSIVFLALVLLLAVYVVYANWRGEREMHAALEKLSARGISAEKQIALFRAPSDQNDDGGARYYEAAFALLGRRWSEDENLPYVGLADAPKLGEPISREISEALARYVESKKDYYQALSKALAYPKPRHRLRQPSSDLLFDLKTVADFQHLASLLAEANGQGDAACDACTATLDVARAFEDDPRPTVLVVRVLLLLEQAYDQIEQSLSRVQPTTAALRVLRERFVEAGEQTDLKRVTEVELIECGGTLRFLRLWFTQREFEAEAMFAAGNDLYSVMGKGAEAEREKAIGIVRRVWDFSRFWLIICPGNYQSGFADKIERILKGYETLNVPDHVLAERSAAEAATEQNKAGSLSSWWDWNLPIRPFLEAKAKCRVAATALSVEARRVEKGAWPQQLAEVAGGDLSDPFTGKPLKYKRVEAGVVVYSVGANLVDDGGKGVEVMTEEDLTSTDDLVFRLLDPERRKVEIPAKSE